MRGFFLVTLVLTQLLFANDDSKRVFRKEPTFLSKGIYIDLKSTLGAFPAPHSAQQQEDEVQLKTYQASRSTEDCARAQSEMRVSLENFVGSKSDLLSKQELEQYSALFEQLQSDAEYFIYQLKADFPRQRPFRYIEGLVPCVDREITGAYPSAQAVQSKLLALLLSEIYPDKKTQFEERALEIAQSGVLSGMHHPTDIHAGRYVAEHLFKAFMKAKDFQLAMDVAKENATVLAR